MIRMLCGVLEPVGPRSDSGSRLFSGENQWFSMSSALENVYDAVTANYRRTVLAAFQGVEDQLTATASLAQQEVLRREASAAADRTEQQVLNRYRAGQVGYTDVVTAQASALSARRALTQAGVNRQVSAVNLIQALGGGWERIETP